MVFRVVLFSLVLSIISASKYYSPEGDISEESGALVQMPILCPPGSALLGFKMEDGTVENTLRWAYDCYESDLIDLKGEKVLFTPWNKTDSEIIWVDRHLMECEDGYVLRGFQMEKVRTELSRFRYNCYPMKTVECQKDLPISTNWYEIDGKVTSLKLASVNSFCDNCPLKGVQMFMKYPTTALRYNRWRYEWCLAHDEF